MQNIRSVTTLLSIFWIYAKLKNFFLPRSMQTSFGSMYFGSDLDNPSFIAIGLKIFRICLKLYVLQLLIEVKLLLRTVLRGESLLFDQFFRPLFSHFETMNFYEVEFNYTFSAGRTARKIIKIIRLSTII